MIQIHGRIKSDETNVTSSSAEFTLTDNTKHRYYFNNGKIFYIVTSSSGEEEKYIELCSDIKSCLFSYN